MRFGETSLYRRRDDRCHPRDPAVCQRVQHSDADEYELCQPLQQWLLLLLLGGQRLHSSRGRMPVPNLCTAVRKRFGRCLRGHNRWVEQVVLPTFAALGASLAAAALAAALAAASVAAPSVRMHSQHGPELPQLCCHGRWHVRPGWLH